MAEPFIIDVPGIGRVELQGSGPWSVNPQGRSTFEIVDAQKRSAKPTLWRALPGGGGGGQKPDANIVWASAGTPEKIVAAANAKWTEAAL